AMQSIVIMALLLTPYALLYAFNANILLYIFLVVAQFLVLLYIFKRKGIKKKILYSSMLFFIIAVAILNGFAYPNLLKYQSSSQVAFYINKQKIPKENLFQKNIYFRAFHYYNGGIVPNFTNEDYKKDVYIFTDENGKKEIEQKYIIKEVKSFEDFNVTRLSLLFLNPNTRQNTLHKKFLLKLE
ncbi:MAG: hypothetical protein H6578_12260, partial [Chitinophagales bacterium]|nr:hypothetical protein [Chitinophagales bacterium]